MQPAPRPRRTTLAGRSTFTSRCREVIPSPRDPSMPTVTAPCECAGKLPRALEARPRPKRPTLVQRWESGVTPIIVWGSFLAAPFPGCWPSSELARLVQPTFDGHGKVTTDIGGLDIGHAVGLQSDGKIVVAGYGAGDGKGNGSDFGLARYNAGVVVGVVVAALYLARSR
jgi:hypothetical protein